MIITVEETKGYLRDVPDEDVLLIGTLIDAAETYLTNATGNYFESTNSLAKLFCLLLVEDWYENRERIGKVGEEIRPLVKSMLTQLSYCYPQEVTE